MNLRGLSFAALSPSTKVSGNCLIRILAYDADCSCLIDPEANEPLPEAEIPPEVAVTNGYTESKWVAEKVLSETASQTSLKPLAVRVGQLCGGFNGAWNSTEWLPSLVQSAVSLKCLPDDERVSSPDMGLVSYSLIFSEWHGYRPTLLPKL